jgi:tRNA pseudouridine38-40 synthase
LGRDPFSTATTWQIHHQDLNVTQMESAVKYLFEYADFKCFSKSRTDVKTYDCKITEAYFRRDGNELIFTITADRFLRNMVRAIVGTLINIGLGKHEPEYMKLVIESKDRRKAGFSVPAKGLFLTKIMYPNHIFV